MTLSLFGYCSLLLLLPVIFVTFVIVRQSFYLFTLLLFYP
ncbi:hypothetical protein PREVCOP_04293 [Segatella copri DSM 18205]|uniref:Uncharacterized protein n=1 Tax=Segatella copri DSM 18205 TaxID=537011 RepID=D1PAR8_9BACT|nr:hypothetical protein PREVCOP_04293 [Segatella copri DSM 18205]